MSDDAAGRYEGLNREQLIQLLEKRDRSKKLGLVWERDEIEADRAMEAEFIAAALLIDKSDPPTRKGGWSNLILEGDNFDSLRWLRMTMAGRIKCVYVDPPYNTGNKDWVYNDHYIGKDDRWRHSTWLEFLFRRFSLARDLLTEDGVILVSINDENRARLELLLDEVLPGMRVGSLVWRTRVGGNEGGEYFISDNHEHVLVYAKAGFRFGGTEKSFELYSNPNNDPRGDWKSGGDLTVSVPYTDPRAGKGYYPLFDPDRQVWFPCNPDAVWRYASREVSGPNAKIKTKFMEDWIAEGQIHFPNDTQVVQFNSMDELLTAIRAGEVPVRSRMPILRESLPDLDFWVGRPIAYGTPSFKRFKRDLKRDVQPLSSWVIPRSELETRDNEVQEIIAGSTDEGSRSVTGVFGKKVFNYAKPPSLIRGLLEQATSPGDIVLDFFAGSSTTAQAVMELNAADGGERRFVMASSTERTEDEPDKNLCDEVTAERVRRLNASANKPFAELNAPFAYLKMVPTAFEDIDYDLTAAQAWTALETTHGLPLTPYPGGRWAIHEGDETSLVLAEAVDDGLISEIKALASRRANVFVYAWAPGQLRGPLSEVDVEVRPLRETLVQRFRR